MIDLHILTHYENIKIFLSNIKYIYIDNYNQKRRIIKTLESYFYKEKDSEYAMENNYTSKILSDGQPLNISDFDFYKITDYFDLNAELKLGAKSLFLKYLESKTSKLDYCDSYQTLKYILQDIEEEIQESISEDIHSINFKLKFELEKKQLLKLLNLVILKEDCFANHLDISFNEIILLQLEMLFSLTKSTAKKTIIVIDIPYIDKKWLNLIKLFQSNVFFLIFCSDLELFEISSKDVFLLKDDLELDFYDDNKIYELILEENKNYTLEEYRAFLVGKLIKK